MAKEEKQEKESGSRLDKLRDLALAIASHQMLIQMLGSKWAALIVERLDASEKRLMDTIEEELERKTFTGAASDTVRRLTGIRKKLAAIRREAIASAREEIRREAAELAENDAKWAKTVTKKLGSEKEAGKLRDLPERSVNALVDRSIINGRSFDQWFQSLSREDAERLEILIQRAVSEGWSIQEVRTAILGTRANGYTDGLLETTRKTATNMARTLCSGVANQAKQAFYDANRDVVIGDEWLSTLDGRTCPACGALDRKRWKPDENHPVPPLHHQCRCVLLPVTPASDYAEESRPAANADFMAEARRMYEKKFPRDKYPNKDWDKLAASTRQEYYYRAIREYEKLHGQGSAFTQVPGGMTYRDYLEQAPDQLKRDILGKYRYEQYKAGKLKITDFIPPYPDRRLTVRELKKRDLASFRRPRA